MNKYYENAEGQLFVDPILANHTGLTEITKAQFNQIIADRNKPTTDQLLQQLTQARKEQETQGVTINGIRYAGDPGNRQALQEAISFMDYAGLAKFARWKDSDNVFHANHPLADVRDAYRAIGVHRAQLIAAEGEYAAQIAAGTLTDLSEVVWP
jgi:transposase